MGVSKEEWEGWMRQAGRMNDFYTAMDIDATRGFFWDGQGASSYFPFGNVFESHAHHLHLFLCCTPGGFRSSRSPP